MGKKHPNRYNLTVLIVFIIIPAVIISLKFSLWDYTFKKILPRESYNVTLNMKASGFGEEVTIKSFLPVTDERQQISHEMNNSGELEFNFEVNESGKLGIWSIPYSTKEHNVSYSFTFIGKAIKYKIDTALRITGEIPPGYDQYLSATENIQTNDPYINQIYNTVVPDTNNLVLVVNSIYNYVYSLKKKSFKGVTDAVTTAKLGEASCNGKSRLFVALARRAGIPSRLVGGIILKSGNKKTSHQWLEIYINGYWIPFDALNGHFASIPANYLQVYLNDEFLFAHTPNINFDYLFNIKLKKIANPIFFTQLDNTPLNAYRVWQAFTKIGIPIDLLQIIIMIPLGALVVAIFRNVIGMQTFGIFLPALIAVASRETGVFYGMVGFLLIISVVGLLHFPLERLRLLYVPKMAIMLLSVVVMFLVTAVVSMRIGIYELSYVTLFPIVILTITSERFGRKISEEGFRHAIILVIQTLIASISAYYVMNSVSMEAVFLAFPELFMVILGINFWLGRWIGIRLTEYFRFKWLIT
jgi:transglutaminase-like putative cysteine protease